jgi:hypothetical protein
VIIEEMRDVGGIFIPLKIVINGKSDETRKKYQDIV